jgi:hypothetical protein
MAEASLEKDIEQDIKVPVDDLPISGFTEHDRRDMERMGKSQELMRNFRLISSIAFTSCVMGT